MEYSLNSTEETGIIRQNFPIYGPSMDPPEEHYESDSDDEVRYFLGLQSFLGLKSVYMPGETTRDFCMRERTYMSWSKFTALATVLSVIFFLDVQISDLDNYANTVNLSLASIQDEHVQLNHVYEQQVFEQKFVSPGYDIAQFETMAMPISNKPDSVPSRTQDIVLGCIYLAVGILSWLISIFDYFERTGELQSEQTFMDECEGHTHPVVTILSVVICFIVLATVIYLLVQHEVSVAT